MDKYQQALIENLKKYRKIRNFSQSQFAELCNVSTGTIGNIECGVAKPSFDLLIRMSEVLDIPASELLKINPGKTDYIKQNNDHKIILQIYSTLQKHLQS